MTGRIDQVIRSATLVGAVFGGAAAAARARRRVRAPQAATRQVMSTPAVTIRAGTTVEEAAATLAASGVGSLPVCDGERRPVGVVTDRDLVVRVLGQETAGARTRVEEITDGDPVVTRATAPLAETAGTMRRYGLRRLPVVDHGRVVGVVSRGDLARHLPARAAQALHRIGSDPRASDNRSGRWLFKRAYA